jgi:DNA repair exonuclease SbcCD nuclease subunit
MRVLHFADVHLDRPFVGSGIEDARARRRELRDAVDRCLAVAREREVDVITIGGDLWEDEHVTPDTLRWVADRLARADVPVVAVAGNHDPLSPGGPYERAPFGNTVCVLPAGPDLTEQRIGDLSVWGMSWRRGLPLTAAAIDRFRVPKDGRRHILLLHGTCGPYLDAAHCPFTADAVRRAGFAICLAGHLHGGGTRGDFVVYPGSPEPLSRGEDGRHTVAIIELAAAGPAHVEFVNVNHRRYAERIVDCNGATSSADIQRRLEFALEDLAGQSGLCLRADLEGRVAIGCDVDVAALLPLGDRYGLTTLDLRDRTVVDFDLDALEAGGGVTGAFVERLRRRLAEDEVPADAELALHLGLRALAGETL